MLNVWKFFQHLFFFKNQDTWWQDWCRENLQGVLVAGEVARALLKHYWGTPEQGTDSPYAHIGPAFAHMQLG